MSSAFERAKQATDTLAGISTAMQRQQNTANSGGVTEYRLRMQEEARLLDIQQRQVQQQQALWQMRLSAEDEWQRRQLGAIQFMLDRTDKAVANGQHVQDLQRELYEKALPTAQQIQANRNMKLALEQAAQLFRDEFADQSFNPDSAEGHTKWKNFSVYKVGTRQNEAARRVIDSLGDQPTHFDNFLRQYAYMTPETRKTAVDVYMQQNGVQEGMDPEQRKTLALMIDSRLASTSPGERELWRPYLQDYITSQDAFVRQRLGPYADFANRPPTPMGGGGGAPTGVSSNTSSPPLRMEQSGEVTAAVPVQTAPGTYTNIVRDAGGIVNKPALQKYDALYGLSQRAAAPPPQSAPQEAGPAATAGDFGITSAPSSQVFSPAAAIGNDYDAKLNAWTQTPGFGALMKDVLTGAHDPNDVFERLVKVGEAVYQAGGNPVNPAGVKNTAGVLFNAVRGLGLVSGGGPGETRSPFPQPRAILSRP